MCEAGEVCWLNKEEVVLRWSSYCFVERITVGEVKAHVGRAAGHFVMWGREASSLISLLYSLLWSIDQGGGTKIKREVYFSSLSSLQEDISCHQLDPKRQKTLTSGVSSWSNPPVALAQFSQGP